MVNPMNAGPRAGRCAGVTAAGRRCRRRAVSGTWCGRCAGIVDPPDGDGTGGPPRWGPPRSLRRWAKAAASPRTAPEALAVMVAAAGGVKRPLWLLATNPQLPPEVFDDLASRRHLAADVLTRLAVAANPGPVPAATLARLAADPDERVRSAVASRPHLPVDVLLELAAAGGTPAVEASRHPSHSAGSRAAAGLLTN